MKNEKSVFSTLGASSHSDYDRVKNDYYATHPDTINDLINREVFTGAIWEPACGEGHMSERLKKWGFKVHSSDLINRGYGNCPLDFLRYTVDERLNLNIITNPPYKHAKEFVEKSLEILQPGRKVAMFLKLTFLESKKREEMFKRYPPVCVYVYSRRQTVARNGDPDAFEKSSAVCYAWFIWEVGYAGDTQLKWIRESAYYDK